ncbi:hypothetical protein MRX96_017354 [Rhipicephalus microplus]
MSDRRRPECHRISVENEGAKSVDGTSSDAATSRKRREKCCSLSSQPWNILAASCTCKAGCRGWCKHAAALAVFVNKKEGTSCMNLPCAFLGPSARPLLETKKKIKVLFTGRPLPTPTLKPLSATVMLSQFPDLKCALRQVLDAEDCSANESSAVNTASTEDGNSDVDPEVTREILEQERRIYHVMEEEAHFL